MKLTGIAATTKDGIIGINNKIPWRYKEDFAFFKLMTIGNTIVMGGNTYRSIGKPLPNRKNVIFTRKGGDSNDSVEFIDLGDRNCMKVIEPYLFENQDIFICGGNEIYNMFFESIDIWYITIINDDIKFSLNDNVARIDIDRIYKEYKIMAELNLSDKCKVIKFIR